MVNRILFVDNSISNSDWTKANAFDFPYIKTVEDFEEQFNIPSEEPARSKRLARLAVLPWVGVAPAPVREFLEDFKEESLVELIKASFGGDRSEAGRYAANIRWQGNIKKTPKQNPNFAPNQSLKAKQDLLRIGANHDRKIGKYGRDLTDLASRGLSQWVNLGTLDINTFLRTNSTKNLMYGNIDEKKALEDIKEDSQNMLECWNELKEKSEEEIVVFRGLATKKSETFKVGSVITDKGWQSTTTNPVFATDWSRTASVFSSLDDQENLETTVFQIKIPKGTEIINLGGFVSELGYAERTESSGVLSEVFLNRGTKYRVVASRNQKDGDAWANRTKKKQYSDSIKIVELEVVP